MKSQPQSNVAGGPVRISIPASVAGDLGALQKGLAAIAERLGCPSCFSGADCRFEIERHFVVGERLQLHAVPGAGALSGGPVVSVSLPEAVAFDIEQIQAVTGSIAERIGCRACCSGFDILFQRERAFLMDGRLNVRPLGA